MTGRGEEKKEGKEEGEGGGKERERKSTSAEDWVC